MEKKYIIQIPEHAVKIVVVGIDEDREIYTYGLSVCNLDSYNEPDLEQVRIEAFQKGYDAAWEDIQPKIDAAYQKGLNDLWEAMQKAIKMYCEIDDEVFLRVFHDVKCDRGESVLQALFKNTPQHLIDSIRQYEQRQEEQIQVGDEVIAASGKAVIIDISDNKDNARYIYSDSTLGFDNICNLSKTGRHFPEVAAVLEKMREDGNQNRIQETMSDDY